MSPLQKYERNNKLGAIGMFVLDAYEALACLITSIKYPNLVGALVIIAALILEMTISINASNNELIKHHQAMFHIFSLICAGLTIIALLIMLFMISPFSPYHQA